MDFTLNPRLIQQLSQQGGPIDKVVKTRAENVEERARDNATFAVIGIVTGNLHDSISTQREPSTTGEVTYVVGSSAVVQSRRGAFSYPGFHNSRDRPWLSLALSEEFQ